MGAKLKEILTMEYTLTAGAVGEFSVYYNGTLVAKKGEPGTKGGFPSTESVIQRIKNLVDSQAKS